MSDDAASWYDQGYTGMKKEEERISQLGGPQRVWVKPQTAGEFVFIDDEPFCFYEHNPKMNGHWRNWITCVKGMADSAPCCDEIGEKTRYYVGYFTVVDCSKWTDKKGNTYQYEVKFLPAKLKTLKKFKRKKEDRIQAGGSGLIGCLYKAHREDDKSPSIGDEFEFQREVDLAKLFQVANYKGKKLPELFAKAAEDPSSLEKLKKVFNVKVDKDGKLPAIIPTFNYLAQLAPKSVKDLKELLQDSVESPDDEPTSFGGKGGGGDKAKASGADENVPF